MKALPVTHKATRIRPLKSPNKVSMEFLVQNDAQVHKQFNDVASDYAAGRKEGIKMTQKKEAQRKEVDGGKDTPPLKEPTINAKEATPTKV